MTELETMARQINQATGYMQVFGGFTGSPKATERHVRRAYRKLARLVHPDLYCQPAEVSTAKQAFEQLGHFYDEALQAVKAEAYGRQTVLATIRSRKATHEIISPLPGGDLCNTYSGRTMRAGGSTASFFKVAREPRDADLLKTEAEALRRLRSADADPTSHVFFPELLDSFSSTVSGPPAQQANVLRRLEGFYNLEQLGTIPPLDMVWMWRRLLVALGHAHDNHVVHGAVLPQHVMILPAEHGVVLVDWCYASLAGTGAYPAVKAVVNNYRAWYSPEVLDRQPPSPATDIQMAARCMIFLVGGNPLTGTVPASVPRALSAFFRGCLQTQQSMRPNNAWLLLQEFDELLERLGSPYYPRRFRPFTTPSGVV